MCGRRPHLFRPWVTLTQAVLVASQGVLSEEGLLAYLHVLQTFLSQLPASPASTSSHDSTSDSEDESEQADKPASPVSPRPGPETHREHFWVSGPWHTALTSRPLPLPITLCAFLWGGGFDVEVCSLVLGKVRPFVC